MTIEKEQILLLGASGATGLVFLSHIQTLPPGSRPKLTAYVRTRSKLPATIQQDNTIHIVEGTLTDAAALETAMQGATTVISFLGAYVSLTHFFLRTKPTPIADAFPGIFATMRKHSVKRILALSTPSAFPQPSETLSWKWALYNTLPVLVVPQGKAEMKGIAVQVSAQTDLEWTVFRVPYLSTGEERNVAAGLLGPEYQGGTELSRRSLVVWVLNEIKSREWVRGAPMLGNVQE